MKKEKSRLYADFFYDIAYLRYKKIMKKFFIFLLLTVLTISCSTMKNNSSQAHIGEWVLIQRSGGIMGRTTSFDADKKEQVLIISPKTISIIEKGQKRSERTYTIEKGAVIESSEPQNILKTNQLMSQSINIENEQLILKGQCADCFTEVYQRIR